LVSNEIDNRTSQVTRSQSRRAVRINEHLERFEGLSFVANVAHGLSPFALQAAQMNAINWWPKTWVALMTQPLGKPICCKYREFNVRVPSSSFTQSQQAHWHGVGMTILLIA
jgi:hypothetical protein